MANRFKVVRHSGALQPQMAWVELFSNDSGKNFEFTRAEYFTDTGEIILRNIRTIFFDEIPAYMEFLKACAEIKPYKTPIVERELA